MSKYKKFIKLLDEYNNTEILNKSSANTLNKLITNDYNNTYPTYFNPYLISNVQHNVLDSDIHNILMGSHFPQINLSNSLSQYALWQKSADVTNELDLNGILSNTPRIEKTKTCHIDVSVNSIQDLLSIVDNHSFQSDTEYNIDLEILHKIKPELTSLNNMIGMDIMKHSVVNQLLYFIQNLHLGNKVGDFKHTVIYGPPGTGKTEVARIIGQMYSKIGILKNNIFRKVTRNDLIAGYLGQTAIKTKQVINDCLGGVLFIDEAYALASPDHNDSFSKECLDILCEALSEHKDDLMVIIAGYESELNTSFFGSNPGLTSRFIWRFSMQPYTMTELNQIFNKMVLDQEWTLDETMNLPDKWFADRKDNFANYGRDIDALITYTKIAHGRRIYGNTSANKKCITLTDLNAGYKHYSDNKQNKQESNAVFGLYV